MQWDGERSIDLPASVCHTVQTLKPNGNLSVIRRGNRQGRLLLMQEPLVEDDVPGKPAGRENSCSERLQPGCGKPTGEIARARFTEPLEDSFLIRGEVLAVIISCGGSDDLGGDQAGFHRRADAFAALRIRQSRGIAKKQHPLIK